MVRRGNILIALLVLIGLLAWVGLGPNIAQQSGLGGYLAAASSEGGQGASALFDEGMLLYAEGAYRKAKDVFERIDPVHLSKEQRVSLYEAIQDIQRQEQARRDPKHLLEDAAFAVEHGKLRRALGLYELVTEHSEARPDQKREARARMAEVQRKLDPDASLLRQSIDEARADIAAGEIEEASSKLQAVRASGVDLGWFDEERIDQYFALIQEKRLQLRIPGADDSPEATEVVAEAGVDVEVADQQEAEAEPVPENIEVAAEIQPEVRGGSETQWRIDEARDKIAAGQLDEAEADLLDLKSTDGLGWFDKDRIERYLAVIERDRAQQPVTPEVEAASVVAEEIQRVPARDGGSAVGEGDGPEEGSEIFDLNSLETEDEADLQAELARIASEQKRVDEERRRLRVLIDESRQDIAVGRLDDAGQKLAAVRGSGIDLGWFDEERIERYETMIQAERERLAEVIEEVPVEVVEAPIDPPAPVVVEELPDAGLDLEEEAEMARRAADEAERARLAEEAELRRLAEEAEAARMAEEAEVARLAEEAEQARLAEEQRSLDEAHRRLRAKIDEARADMAVGNLDDAEAKLQLVQGMSADLGWFDQERVDRYLAAIDRQREELALAAEQAERDREEAERQIAEEMARAEQARLEAEKLEAERLRIEAEQRAERERMEAERLEAERLAAEAALLEDEKRFEEEQAELARRRAEAEALAESDRIEAERLEAERMRIEAEERAERERIEAERLLEEAAERAERERLEAERRRIEAEKQIEEKRLADERARAEAALRLHRQQIDQATADIAAGHLDEAHRKLMTIQGSGVDLGWFDQGRVERYLAVIDERRVQLAQAPVQEPQPVVQEPRVEVVEPSVVLEVPDEIVTTPVVDTTPVEIKDPEPVVEAVAPSPEEVAPPAAVTVPVDDLLAQAKWLRAQERFAQGQAAEREAQFHLAVRRYEEALLLAPGYEEAKVAIEAAQIKADQDSSPRGVMETELRSRRLRAQAAVSEFEQLSARASKLLSAGDYAAARASVQQAKVVLDLSQRLLPGSQYKNKRQEAVDLSAEIDQADRAAEAARLREDEVARKRDAERRRIDAMQARQGEVQKLLRRAADLRREQKYDQALELLNQALFLDPNNVATQAMKEMIEDSRLYVEARARMRRRDLLSAESSVDNLEATLPYTDLVTYPADWPQLTSTRLSGFDPYANETEINRQTVARLKEAVPVNFDENALIDVIDYLRNTAGVNMFVNWAALETIGIEKEMPISLQLSNISVQQALRLVLQQASALNELEPVSFSVIEGIVTISTERDLSRTTDIRPYDIRDLLVQVPSFTDAPEFDLKNVLTQFGDEGSSEGLFGDEDSDVEDITREQLVEQITTLLRETVGRSDEWAANGGDVSSLRELNGNLIVKTTPKSHRLIRDLLRQLRETRALQIAIEARFLLVDQNFLDEVGVDLDISINSPGSKFGPIDVEQDSISIGGRQTSSITPEAFIGSAGEAVPNAFSLSASYLDDIEVNLFVKATQASRRSISLTAPRLTLFNGQRAYVVVARQIAFISDLEPIPDAAGFDTTVSVTQSGVILDVEATVNADRRYVTMTVRPSLATLVVEPIRQVRVGGIATVGTGDEALAFPIERVYRASGT